MTTAEMVEQDAKRRDALVERLFESGIAALEVYTVYLGERLGLYQALAEGGPATVAELAARTGTQERYAREWLEQQAAAGILEAHDPAAEPAGRSAEPAARRYALPAAYRDVFLEPDSLSYLGGFLRLIVGVTNAVAAVQEAFTRGGGVAYRDYGVDTREGIALMNRPMFLNQLGADWLPALPEIDARLRAEPPARIADIGCGTGWSSIAIARAYPRVRVDGFDLDEASVTQAAANAEAAGVAGRVTFQVRDAADPLLAGRYDLVMMFETLHDMARPVEALGAMRRLLAPGGAVLIADERVGEAFAGPADAIERLNYAFSVLHCLPATMAEGGPLEQATGTVMRPPTLRRYAEQAGFRDVTVLPIEHDFWRFYRLDA
jgi:SAM-dependent methyltransferase